MRHRRGRPSLELEGKLAVLLLAGLPALPAIAQENTDDLEALLDEPLVASATRSAEAVSAAPATSTIISAAELRQFGIRSLDDAINYLSTGMNAENPLATAEVGARGVLISSDYGVHVLLLVDGHAMNEVWGGTAYFDRGAGIPFEIIDHIEVIVGPGSVLYGSNAMLGVINIVTKRARDYRGLHAVVESEVLPGSDGAPGFSLRTGVGTGFDFDFFGQKGELTVAGEYFTMEGPAFKLGPQNYGADSVTGEPRFFSNETPLGVWGGVADETYYHRIPTGYLRLALGDFQLKARATLFERSYPTHGGNFDDPENYELDRWVSLDMSYKGSIGSRLQAGARLYGDVYDYQQFYVANAAEECLDGQVAGCLYYLNGNAKWAGLELSASLDWLGDARFETLVGVDSRVKNVGQLIDISNIETGDTPGAFGLVDETELALGIYAQQALRPAKWLAFNAGARIDVDQRYGVFASPRFAATLSPFRGSAFKAIYAKAFRAPTAFERYYADSTSQVPASDLKPEVVRSIEGSFEQRFGTQRLEFGGFQSSWSDLVFTEELSAGEIEAAVDRGELEPGTSYAEQTRNAAAIEAYGYTARFQGSALGGKLSYGASVTRAHSRRSEPGLDSPVELGAAAQVFGNARIAYDFMGDYPAIALASRFTGERPANRENLNGTRDIAPPQLELRGSVSGPIVETGLDYRVSGSYAFADRYPYTVGPGYLPDGSSELTPVDQIKVAVGLSYDLEP